MNKQMIKNVVLALSFFVAGAVTHQILTKNDSLKSSVPQDNQFVALDRSFVDTFNNYLENYCLTLARYNSSEEELRAANQMKFLCSHLPVVEYNITTRKDNRKIISEMMDTISVFLPSVEKGYLSDKFKNMLSSFAKENKDDKTMLCNLHVLENMLINLYLSHIYRNSVLLSYAELLNDASKDTIRLGETYHSKLTFSVTDISGNSNVVEISDDSTAKHIPLEGCTFVETPESKGKHHHDLLLFVTGFFGNRGWHTAIDYTVK